MTTFHLERYVDRLREAARHSDFRLTPCGYVNRLPMLVLQREANDNRRDAPHLYLSAGIHGDEPAGPLALLRLLQNRSLPRDVHWTVFPMLNPTGLATATRENADGVDLNRDYFSGNTHEVRAHREWIAENGPDEGYRLALLLHEDWEARGFYLYELKRRRDPSPAPAILAAAGEVIAIDESEVIDDYPARDGRIAPLEHAHYDLANESELPGAEAIYLFKKCASSTITIETPSSLPIAARVDAQVAAVLAAVQNFLSAP